MYNYYFKVSTEEHYLNATEIAKIMNLFTTNGLQHSRMASAALRKVQGASALPQAYYYSGKSMMAVYPEVIYMAAIRYLQMITAGKRDGGCSIDGKNYNFVKKMPDAKIYGTTTNNIFIDEISSL